MKCYKFQKAFFVLMIIACVATFYWILRGRSKTLTINDEPIITKVILPIPNTDPLLEASKSPLSEIINNSQPDIINNLRPEITNDSLLEEPQDPLLEKTTIVPAFSYKVYSALTATTIIKTSELNPDYVEQCFYKEEISNQLFKRIQGKSYGDACTLPLSDFKHIRILYYGFDHETHIGELIVHTQIADDTIDIFKELYAAKYPIEQVKLIDDYDANDNTSMSDNNSSSFNYRVIDGTTTLSKHSLGLAIDINPLYNPYVRNINGLEVVLPEEGVLYTDRQKDLPYMIKEGDICHQAFIKRGFTWGGIWNHSKDYQHFQKSINE